VAVPSEEELLMGLAQLRTAWQLVGVTIPDVNRTYAFGSMALMALESV